MKPMRVIMILAVLLLISTVMDAQVRGRAADRGPRGERPDRARFHEILNLTEEQDKMLTDLAAAHREKTAQIRSELQEVRVKVREAMQSDQPDMVEIERMIQKRGELQSAMSINRIKHLNKVREILTPEQYETWKQRDRKYDGMRDRRTDHRRPFRGRE